MAMFCQSKKKKIWKILTYKFVYINKAKNLVNRLLAQWILEIADHIYTISISNY